MLLQFGAKAAEAEMVIYKKIKTGAPRSLIKKALLNVGLFLCP